MSKNLVFGLAVIMIALAGYFYTTTQKPASEATTVQENTIVKNEIVKTESAMTTDSPRYTPFTPDLLTTSSSTRRILYFYATWCPSCKVANAEFLASPEKIPQDVVVLRVNYNDPDTDEDEKALARKYNITYQHTFVQIDKGGNEITKWNGGGISELLAKIK